MDITLMLSFVFSLVGVGVIVKGLGLERAAAKVDAAEAVVPKEEQVKAARRGAMLFYVVGGLLVLSPLLLWFLARRQA